MVALLDVISEYIQTYNWGYLYNCAYIVLTRLVREFYTHLELMQDEDSSIVFQSTVEGHVILVNPQVINQIIGVPMLQISASSFNEVLVASSLEDLREFFHAIPQGQERATNIKSVHFLPHTTCSQRLSNTISGLLSGGVI
jgi:hypothetical protein